MTPLNIDPATNQFYPQECAGVISSGTMRAEHLIPLYLRALANTVEYSQMMANNALVPNWVFDEGFDCPWWDSEEAGYLITELEDVLMDYAPEGYYFGAQDGDGPCFGFWEHEPAPAFMYGAAIYGHEEA